MIRLIVVSICVLAQVQANSTSSLESLITVPNLGKIKGLALNFEDAPEATYYQYKAIPYGGPTKRFAISKPAQPWEGVHDGTVEGKICPQLFGNVEYPGTESEDCLVLTVSTPQNPRTIKTSVPVVVFIHGGMFNTGNSRTSLYDPETLVQEGVVVVQPNYRLGVLGWITDGEIIPKNLGLKDIRLALRWIQSHISHFGGDPTNVTIYGESAGSVIVSTLWQSQRLSNLFNKVFMQSGTVINPWGIQKQSQEVFKSIIQASKCNDTVEQAIEEQVECLKTLPYVDLNVLGSIDILITDVINARILDGILTAIVLEDPQDSDAIVVRNPMEQLESGDFRRDAPLLISGTSEEMYTFGMALETLRWKSNSELVPGGMMAEDKGYVGGLIKTYYAKNESNWTWASRQTYISYASDVLFNYPLRRYVELILPKLDTTSIYVLQFSYASEMGRFNDGNSSVGHSDDLIYTWKEEDFTKESSVKNTYPPLTFYKRKQFNRMLGNFIKFGNPTPKEEPLLDNLIWPRVSTSQKFEYLNFNYNNTIGSRPKDENYNFWSGLYQEYGEGKIGL